MMKICGICGGNHHTNDCDIIQIVVHVTDSPIPSKAKLTLPQNLTLTKTTDNSYRVTANSTIAKGTKFGPLQAKKNFTFIPAISFPLRIFVGLGNEEHYLDTTDENECNWLIFISPACDFQEQNVVCYQEGEDIFYVTVKEISKGEDLKVWYSPYYATKMKTNILKPIINELDDNLKTRKLSDALIKRNKQITSREMWSCKFCGKSERKVPEFALHLLKHYSKKLERRCHLCNMSFLKVKSYQKHVKIVHEKVITDKTPTQIALKSSTSNNVEKSADLSNENYVGGPLLTNEVNYDSTDNTGLVLPQTDMDHQNMQFEQDNLNMESILSESVKDLDNFNFELVENDTEQFVCDICLKVFKKVKSLIQHMNKHTGKFTCIECNKVFARQENLNYHSCKLLYKFQCYHCSKLFYQKKYLSRHMKLFHNKQTNGEETDAPKETNSNPSIQHVQCSKCSKMFAHKSNLIIHLKTHLPREKYICPICDKLLISQKTFVKHYKLHKDPVVKCTTCDKILNRKDTLKYHMESVHSGNEEICSDCGKPMKTKKILNTHKKAHETTKTYDCPRCTLKFNRSFNLTRHIKVVHESKKIDADKKFACAICDRKFKFNKSLTRHIRTIHPHEPIEQKSAKLKKCAKISNKIDDSVAGLKRTIDSMHFTNIDNFDTDSNDRLVESLINNHVGSGLASDAHQTVSMMSMLDLDIDGIN
ncbi:unnamed protein product [Phyllotreta striolata]|uniref:Uncharacterized protein n=1 Tax=Phyllotreta striolata TaxID=444603 RepID=A0A9N9TQZ4_PHYSR|nr:unnamed protein product [Phyllotreta striolata]